MNSIGSAQPPKTPATRERIVAVERGPCQRLAPAIDFRVFSTISAIADAIRSIFLGEMHLHSARS